MFAQALKFKDKYNIKPEIPTANNNKDIYSELQLIEAKKLLLKNKSFLEAKNSIIKAEFIALKNAIDAFLSSYFEKTLCRFEALPFDYIEKLPEVESEFKFDDFKKFGIEKQIKAVFKKIAKITHPDLPTGNHNDYIEAQKFRDFQDLESLYWLYNKLSDDTITGNIISEIENLEKEVINLQVSNSNYEKILDELMHSNEYILFIKYKYYEAKGVDFYKEVLKIVEFN